MAVTENHPNLVIITLFQWFTQKTAVIKQHLWNLEQQSLRNSMDNLLQIWSRILLVRRTIIGQDEVELYFAEAAFPLDLKQS